jgi:hypothetical protein
MKLSELKKTLKEVVKEAIQEELKDMLYESFKSGGQTLTQTQMTPPPIQPKQQVDPQALRESYKNILGETAANFNTSQVGRPLQMNGPVDTTSPNGRLPEGEVSIDQIMGIMNKG